MRYLLPLALLALVLSACFPAATVRHAYDQDTGTVTITATATRTIYGAELSIINAITTDPRCVPSGERDASCSLGDLSPGATVTILGGLHAEPDPDPMIARDAFCLMYGFIAPERSITNVRTFACQAR